MLRPGWGHRPYLESRYLDGFRGVPGRLRQARRGDHRPNRRITDRLAPRGAPAGGRRTSRTRGRLDASWSPERRAAELDRRGDRGRGPVPGVRDPVPDELADARRHAEYRGTASIDQLSAGYRAYNRWLADFRSFAPERWPGMAAISLHDIDAAVKEIKAVKEMGFARHRPARPARRDRLTRPRYDPIWAALQELGLVVNVHVAIATSSRRIRGAPTLTSARAMVGAESSPASGTCCRR